jgi:hypothetical protein
MLSWTRKPKSIPPPSEAPLMSMADSLADMRRRAPTAWLPDLERAIDRVALRDWWIVWELMQRIADVERGTQFGQEAARLAERAQRLDDENYRPPPPAPARRAPGYW